MRKKVIQVLFIMGLSFYTIFIVWNILFKYVSPLELFSQNRYFSRTLNLIPFHDLIEGYFNQLDIFGNILLYIPFGIYISLFLKRKKAYYGILLAALTSLFFEIFQYVFAIGASDITDIILNTIGGAIGVGIYMLIRRVLKNEDKVKTFVAICSALVLVPVAGITAALIILN